MNDIVPLLNDRQLRVLAIDTGFDHEITSLAVRALEGDETALEQVSVLVYERGVS